MKAIYFSNTYYHKFICHYIDNANDTELKINETARSPLV